MKEPISRCCGAPVRVEGDETMFWRCTMCNQPCDAEGGATGIVSFDTEDGVVELKASQIEFIQPP